MDRKKLILLVGALLIAAVTAFMARSLFVGAPAPQAAAAVVPSGAEVLVATRAMPVGTLVTADAYSWQPWPKELVEAAYFVKKDGKLPDITALPGTVVRHAITAGQPLTKEALVAPGDRGFLAAALGPGMRAVTVPVSGLTGVAGFVFPGDRVDLVLTQKVDGVEGPSLKVAETIIRNLRVLATDQNVVPTVDEKGKTVPTQSSLVTLEATPRIAEKITVAQTIGTISLSLRALSGAEGDLDAAIASGEVSVGKVADPAAAERALAEAATQPSDKKSSYSTGGDVSRFQRRSIPPQTPKQVAQVRRAAVVRVSRGGSVSEVELNPSPFGANQSAASMRGSYSQTSGN